MRRKERPRKPEQSSFMLKRFLLLTIAFLCCFSFATAQKKDKKDVLDYYKMVPDNMLANEGAMAKLTVKDIKNGYLKIEGAFEGYVEVALFRKKDRSAILLVGNTYCGPVCGTDLKAFEYIENELKDVTKTVMPKLTEDQVRAEYRRKVKDPNAEMVSYIFELPRKGRTVKILDDESGKLIYSLRLKKGKFVVIQ